jgi:hypothetical protein
MNRDRSMIGIEYSIAGAFRKIEMSEGVELNV